MNTTTLSRSIASAIAAGDAPLFPAFAAGMNAAPPSSDARCEASAAAQNLPQWCTYCDHSADECGCEDDDGYTDTSGWEPRIIQGYHDSGSDAAPPKPAPKGTGQCLRMGVELETGLRNEDALWRAFVRATEGGPGFRFEEDTTLPGVGVPVEIISPYGTLATQYELWAPLLTDTYLHWDTINRRGPNGTPAHWRQTGSAAQRHLMVEGLFGWYTTSKSACNLPERPVMGQRLQALLGYDADDALADPARYAQALREGSAVPVYLRDVFAVLGGRKSFFRDVAASSACSTPYGMHVHVGYSNREVRGVQRRVMASVLLSLLACDTMQYVWLVGRVPDDNYHMLPTQGDAYDRYDMVSCRERTHEFRCFASTMNPRLFFARLELVHALREYAEDDDHDLTVGGAWLAFATWLRDTCTTDLPNLRSALGLYPLYEAYALDRYKGSSMPSMALAYVQPELPLSA